MTSIKELAKTLYFRISGFSYTNLGRLFLRLFVGIMLLQFGIKQIAAFDANVDNFPPVLGMSQAASMITMICLEVGCSIFIMAGFLTRLMVIPPIVAMCIAEAYLMRHEAMVPTLVSWQQQGYLPVMFIGIYFFILLVGPGKISIDYFLSLHMIHSEDRNEEDELEEV